MADSLKIQGVVEVSTEGAESSLGRVGSAADKMAINMTEAGAKAGKAVDQIGEIAKATGEKFTRAESAITGSFKKLAVEAAKGKSVLEGLGNIEFNIAAKGLDPAKFKEMGTVVRQLAAEYAHLESAQARTSGSSGQMASRLQNTSYQLQDFIVQVNGGTDASKALGQQLPQMLVGFGAMGAAVGVVAALLPNLISAFSASAAGAKTFSDAMGDFDKAIGEVGSTTKQFDMEKLYEEFNKSSGAVRAATIEQIKFQQEYIKTTQLVAGKKFGESIGGFGDYSTLDKLAGSFAGSGAEKLAKQLGVSVTVAKDLLPVLNGLKTGSEDVSLAFGKFGTTLLGGNAKAVELAQSMATLSKSEQDAASASSSLSEAQAKMAKGHVQTKKELDELGKSTKSAAKEADALKVLLDKLHGTEDNAFSSDYISNVEKLIKGWSAGTLKIEQFRIEMGRLVAMQPGVKALAKETEELAKTRDKYAQGISKETESLIKKAEAAEYENAKIGMTADQLEYLTRARYADEIATKQNEAAMIESIWGRNSEVEAIEKQIDALKRLQGAEVARPKLQAQAKEWEKFTDDINRALTDALMRGFEDGKSFGQNFVDSLKNSLKTAALKIVVNVATSTGGSLVNSAINAVAGTSDINGGSGKNYFGLASNANTAYNLYNGSYLDTLGSAASYGSTTLGYTYGTNAFSQQSSMLAAQDAGVAGSGMGSSAWATMLEGGWVALIPIIGKALFGSTERYLDTSIQGTLGSDGFAGKFGDTYKTTGNIFGAVGRQTDWYPVTDSSADIAGSTAFTNKSVVQGLMAPSEYGGYSAEVQTMLDESLSSQLASITEQSAAFKKAFESIYDFSKTSLQNIAGVFEDSTLADKIKDYAVAVDLQFSGSVDKVFADFGEKVMVGMGSSWLPSVEALRASGETWSQALGRLVNESAAMGQILLAMGTSIKEAFGANQTDAILKASDSLVKLFGSVEKLGESFGAYYTNFYSQDEINKKAMTSLQDQFKSFGLVMPTTRAEFRKMVDALDLTTTSGQTTFKSLMDLQGGFAALVPAIDSVTDAIDVAGRKTWGDKLSILNGTKTQRQISFANDLAGTKDTGVQDLIRQVYALEDAATAAAKALQTSIDTLQTNIDTLVTTFGDVASAMLEINPPAKTLVDSWRDNKTAMQSLQSTFDQFFGVTVPDAAATIQALLTQLSTFEGGAATARSNADNARLQGMSPSERAAFWKAQEASLWQGLGQSNDKAGTINKIMEAYSNTRTAELEALTADQTKLNDTTKTGLNDQLEAWKTTLSVIEKAKSFAKDLEQFMGSLSFSDLSALNYNDQLSAAEKLYSTTLAGAKSGDVDAMGNYTGNAQSYLEEARAMFGSGLEYANIYAKVTGDASGLGIGLNQDGTQAQSEIDRLTTAISGLTTTIPSAFAQETSDGYIRIEGALTAGADYSRMQMDEQKALLQKQIAQQQEIIANQQAQIEQQAALHAELMAQQAAQTARLTALESNASLAGAGA